MPSPQYVTLNQCPISDTLCDECFQDMLRESPLDSYETIARLPLTWEDSPYCQWCGDRIV